MRIVFRIQERIPLIFASDGAYGNKKRLIAILHVVGRLH